MKNVHPLLFFFAGNSLYSPAVCLYETNFPNEEGHSIFKTLCTAKERWLRFVFKHKHTQLKKQKCLSNQVHNKVGGEGGEVSPALF